MSSSHATAARVSGHVRTIERDSGPVWYVKYRLPNGRQVQRKLGPAWTERGRPPAGYFTKRTAEEALQALLTDARRGTLPGSAVTGATFGDAVADWLRYVEHDRKRKPSTSPTTETSRTGGSCRSSDGRRRWRRSTPTASSGSAQSSSRTAA